MMNRVKVAEGLVATSARRTMVRASLVLGVLCWFGVAPAQVHAQACPTQCVLGPQLDNDIGKECVSDTDCNYCNPASPGFDQPTCNALSLQGGACQAKAECVHLEWRPPAIGATGPGQVVTLGLYAVSSTGADQGFESVEAILSWDPTKLKLLGRVDPCQVLDPCTEACPANTYEWLSSTFPNDCNTDALNTPCPGDPENDGDAFYIAISRILCGVASPAPNPVASAAGLHVTDFSFEVLTDVGTSSEVTLLFDAGGVERTRVLGGNTGAQIVTGLFPGSVLVSVEDCNPPTVRNVGSRVIEIDPGTAAGPIGFFVQSDDPGLSCMARWAQADGTLGAGPVFQTPSTWGSSVFLRGRRIIPGATYRISTDCGIAGAPTLSTPVSVTMGTWADNNGDTLSNLLDISRAVTAFLRGMGLGNPPLLEIPVPPDAPIRMVDVDIIGRGDPNPAISALLKCIPDGNVDLRDIAGFVGAFLFDPGNPGPQFATFCDIDFCSGP